MSEKIYSIRYIVCAPQVINCGMPAGINSQTHVVDNKSQESRVSGKTNQQSRAWL